MKLNQVTVGCLDYKTSVSFYTTLGLMQIVDAPPAYARFETTSGETFSIHKIDAVKDAGVVVYFENEALDKQVEALKAAGLVFDSGPKDESWGWREARLRDPAGNTICLYQAGDNRRFPPWRMDGKTKYTEDTQ